MKLKKLIGSFILIFLLIILLNIKAIAKMFFPLYFPNYIAKYSNEYNLSPYLVAAVIKTESNFDTGAVSGKNAYGLMQITDSTGEWAAKEMKLDSYSIDRLKEPEYNIKMGCWYIDNLKKEFDNNIDLVLAAYNGGRGNVQKWLSEAEHSKDGKNLHYIPFKETDKYIKKVKVNYNIYKFIYSNTFNS